MLRIAHKLGNKATQLSGGEMQRVAIGRALVREPKVFLMDEPMSSLDAKLREDLRAELKRIQVRLGATLIYVTHDQVEATTMADRIGIMRQGRLEQVATPQQTYNDPNSIYVAQRLGSPPINVLPAQLAQGVPSGAVTVGVRPEDVVLDVKGQSATVELVESLGAQYQVLLNHDQHEVRALVALDNQLRRGQQVSVYLPPEKLLFFNNAGERIRI